MGNKPFWNQSLSHWNHQNEALIHKWLEYISVSHDFELPVLSFAKVKCVICTGKSVNGRWLLTLLLKEQAQSDGMCLAQNNGGMPLQFS